ncbi:hypothetical protein, partial [Escherichia coli]|uniref:hypothetical protein n=1 Tax=Escherichia coli TaxID=562 RepID=UPI003EE3EDB6
RKIVRAASCQKVKINGGLAGGRRRSAPPPPLPSLFYPECRQGRAKRVPFTLDDTPDKTGLAVVGVARSDAFHLPDRR